MKVAWCLQHVPFEGPGAFQPVLETRGYSVQTRLVPLEGLPPDSGDFLLIMGGPMSVNDPDIWISQELHFLQVSLNRNIPILGICFGAQLLAKALGATVTQGPLFEIGMVPVTLTDEAKFHPVFGHLPQSFPVFQWHGEGMTLPQEAVLLAASSNFPVQAFQVQNRIYGLLFHPEIDEAGIRVLCQECPDDVQKGGLHPETLHAQALPYLPTLHQLADRLITHLTQ